jgi:hypothetical protein
VLACLDCCGFIEDFLSGWLKDAIKPAEDGQRQDDFAVLSRLVGTAEQIRNLPDE